MAVKVETNGLIYDESDPLCRCYVSNAQGKLYAFLQVIDTGCDGRQRYTKRYWGAWDWHDKEGAALGIMRDGGKWPDLPKEDNE